MSIKDLIVGLLMVLNGFTHLVSPHPETPPLKSFLISDSCQHACFLGIEPDITTKAQVQQILADAGLAYTDYDNRSSDSAQVYQILLDDTTSSGHYPFHVVNIAFYIAADKQDLVAYVMMLIDETPVQDIVDLFGYPFDIQTDAYRHEFRILYPDQGVIFTSGKTSPNHDSVGFVHIGPSEYLLSVYGGGDSLSSLPTCEYVVLCAIPTATP